MNMIISIPDDAANKPLENNLDFTHTMLSALMTGIRLPDNATNGDMIKAIFPYACFEEYEDEWRHIVIMRADGKASIVRSDFEWDWWKSPYKGGQKDGKA